MTPTLTPDADAEELREVVRDFLTRHGGAESVLHGRPAGPDERRKVWQRFAGELGAAGLDLPEHLGGAGASFREVAVVAEEMGRSLACLPWLSTSVMALGVLAGTGEEELAGRLAAGEATAAVALADAAPADDPAAGPVTADQDASGGWRVTGRKDLVVDADGADVLLVAATAPDGPVVLAVDAGAPGLSVTPVRTLDPTRPLASVVLRDGPARLVAGPDTAGALLDRLRDRTRAALACEQTGGTAAALDMAVRYACDRVQFGRPIGTFQAIKHRCADMLVQLEAARSASLWAAACAADDEADLPVAARTAALVCGRAYSWVAGENVQVHGGIGFTWEHPAHLHVRRAATSRVLPDGDAGTAADLLDMRPG
ncbi:MULTISPECIES: acyl-CoA dehydrogenase family protein [Pseudonocardia]|uniref:Acyl-CoA dehydrogenase, short-chain specific n=2 Tax=Pseudonocardia TaxID=1847 RepID=A0A1Y2MPA0_PSEAH|nr:MULTISPECIES: acyl-CoA dehydrogenase family protein [Pseudonocardia]OSY37053.1 Acyl-CoA dehydrogenase, short-chain specific [Pseudonocardia autotrophica]TDN72026.1 acyl-CoA dehydrogenase [Pseudonocardia autotrophica]BBG02721.1 acyl-CoA dehydrogenase [Pseudonocardia autotrophica]GEC25946.1 acyl-CoA dehydrogenase [Pseudonocardia saturnea]